MADVVYSVEVQYLSKGNLANGLKSMKDVYGGLEKSLKSVSSTFNSAFDSVASSILSGATNMAAGIGAALAGGFAIGLSSMMKFNEEMENAKTSIAAISVATGESSGIGNGVRIAGDVLKEMRRDAQKLPGSFEDLQKIFTLIRPALGHAGVGSAGSEKIAANLMAAGKLEGIKDLGIVGREYAALVEGRATSRMPLFTKLGLANDKGDPLDAKAFNQLGMKDRMRLTNAAIERVSKPGMPLLENNWNTIKETAIDNLKMALGSTGGDLFERIKGKVAGFNNLAGGARGQEVIEKLGIFGEHVSKVLVDSFDKAFEHGERFWRDWIPLIRSFGRELGSGIRGAMAPLMPLLHKLPGAARNVLGDPLAFEKMAHAAKTLIALRAGSSALGAASGIPGMATAIGGLGVALLPAIAAIAALALAADGAVSAILNVNSIFHSTAMQMEGQIMRSLSASAKSLGEIWDNIQPVREALGISLLGGIEMVVGAFQVLVGALSYTTAAFHELFEWIHKKIDPTHGAYANTGADDSAFMYDMVSKTRNPLYMNKVFNADTFAHLEKEPKEPPNHTTHIHNVEIKVNSNQDPNRIAKRTVDILADMRRHPKVAQLSGQPHLSR